MVKSECAHEWRDQPVAPVAVYLGVEPARFESARLCEKCGALEVVARGKIESVNTVVRIA